MEIPEYKSNSHKSKEQNSEVAEREKIEKVVSGTVKIKKKSGFRKFFSDIIAEEGPDLKNYIVKDKNGILFDDELNNRNNWRGLAIDPTEENINEVLRKLMR